MAWRSLSIPHPRKAWTLVTFLQGRPCLKPGRLAVCGTGCSMVPWESQGPGTNAPCSLPHRHHRDGEHGQ